jgi:hypothetical protein
VSQHFHRNFGYIVMAMDKFKPRWSSNLLSDSEKMRRLVVCVNFVDALRSVEMGHFLRSQGDSTQREIGLCAQSIVASIISNVQERNDRWVAFAADQLGKSEGVIRDYLERGNGNVLFANLTHITHQILHSLKDNWDMATSSSFILPSLSNFDARNMLPELQDSFLVLWDNIEHATNESVPVMTFIRDGLLNLYIALTRGDASTTPPNPSDSIYPCPRGGRRDGSNAFYYFPPYFARRCLVISLLIFPSSPSHSGFKSYHRRPGWRHSPPGCIPEAARRPTTAAASIDPTPLGGQGRSGPHRS